MEITLESDTYAPIISDTGKYDDCMPRFGANVTGYYCPCGARKDKLYTSASIMSSHMKTKTHQKWLELLNLNRTNYLVENVKLKETIASQQQIIARLDIAVASKDATIDYLTKQLSYKNVEIVSNLFD
jgi:hypothetical protein